MNTKNRYVVQTVLPWSSITINGEPMPDETHIGATGYLAVFDDLEKAKAFADGDAIKAIVTEDKK